MDAIVPGGTRHELTPMSIAPLRTCLQEIALEVQRLRTIYDEHEGVRDRFSGAGTATVELAERLGLTGLAGRASGLRNDVVR